jgi:hypothetical protein
MPRYLVFLLFLLLNAAGLSGELLAQNTPVQLVMQVRPPNPRKLSELITNNKLSVYVLLKDLNQVGLDVYFRWTLQGPNLTLTQPADASTSRLFRLSPGLTTFEGDKLDQLLGITSQAGANLIPGGIYTLTINVVEAHFGRAVSAPMMVILNLSGNLPPIVNFPAESIPVRYANPQNFAIQWMPRITDAELRQRVTYQIQLFELRPSNYDPNIAVQSQRPVFDVILLIPGQTVYNYSPKDPLLIPGQYYALRVRAVDPIGEVTFDNDGWSPVRKFLYEGCPPVGNINYAWQDSVLTVRVMAPQTNVHRYYTYSIFNQPIDAPPLSEQRSVYSSSAYFSDVLGAINANPSQKDIYTISVTGFCDNNLVSQPTLLALQPLDQCPSLRKIKTEWRDSVLVITPNKSPYYTKFELRYRPKSRNPTAFHPAGTYYGTLLMVTDFYRLNRADSTYEFIITATCAGGKQSQQKFNVVVPHQLDHSCPAPKLKESHWIDSTLVVTLDSASLINKNYQTFTVSYRKAGANLAEGPFPAGPIRLVNLYGESQARTNITVSITAGCPHKITSLPLTFDTTIPDLAFPIRSAPRPY